MKEYTYRGIERKEGEFLENDAIKLDLSDKWDFDTVIKNPHKGLYHHYYDNGLDKYLCERDEELTEIEGLTELYLRFDWSDIEPEENVFNWEIVDSVIRRFCEPYGYKLSFLICCKETSRVFATPEWVMRAGAKGEFYPDNDGCWSPDYGDAVFLEKLENMHRTFAERYAESPYTEEIVIGSLGDWGEGHTCFSGRKPILADIIKKHIDMYAKCYPKTQKIINDDVIRFNLEENPEAENEIIEYCIKKGFGIRDDGIGVRYFFDNYPDTYTVARPEYFKRIAPEYPTAVELEHYSDMKQSGVWQGENGSVSGADIARGALELMSASYFGFHGYAREWYGENPELADEIANKCGYWYFLKSISLPKNIRAGEKVKIGLSWINRGVARAYHQYRLSISFENGDGVFTEYAENSDNRKWLPNQETGEVVSVVIPEKLVKGKYKLKLRLDCVENGRSTPVKIAFREEFTDSEGFYLLVEDIDIQSN